MKCRRICSTGSHVSSSGVNPYQRTLSWVLSFFCRSLTTFLTSHSCRLLTFLSSGAWWSSTSINLSSCFTCGVFVAVPDFSQVVARVPLSIATTLCSPFTSTVSVWYCIIVTQKRPSFFAARFVEGSVRALSALNDLRVCSLSIKTRSPGQSTGRGARVG